MSRKLKQAKEEVPALASELVSLKKSSEKLKRGSSLATAIVEDFDVRRSVSEKKRVLDFFVDIWIDLE
jgi:hypothetical protein